MVDQQKVEIINHNEGWIDIYADGKHVYGGHSISAETLLELFGIKHTTRWISEGEMYELSDKYPGLRGG